jgi:hypothetical protein
MADLDGRWKSSDVVPNAAGIVSLHARPPHHGGPYIVEANTFRAEKPRLWSETRYIPRAGEAIDLHPLGDGFALAGVVE